MHTVIKCDMDREIRISPFSALGVPVVSYVDRRDQHKDFHRLYNRKKFPDGHFEFYFSTCLNGKNIVNIENEKDVVSALLEYFG